MELSTQVGTIGAMRLGELLDLTYNAYWAGSKSEDTSYSCASDVVRVLGRDTRVEDVLPANYLLALKQSRLSPSTINRKMSALSKMLNTAVEFGHLDRVPKIPRLKEPEPRSRFLSRDEEEALFSHLPHDVRALCTFLVETGLRVGEARALSWSDVQDGFIHIRNTKGGKPRALPLTGKATRALSEQRHLAKPWVDACKKLRYAWDKAKEAVGMAADKEVVPHCLRHTCASRLVQGGVDLLTVQKWLGHSNLAMTARYAHLAPDALQAGLRALENRHE